MYLYVCHVIGFTYADTMDDMNIPANDVHAEQAPAIAPPIRTDDQILPVRNWVPIGKSNCVLDILKAQKSPISQVAVAILKNTNFLKAFMASSTILAIHIQQFWDIIDALQITPTNDNDPFVAPPSSDTIIEYVNTLGYTSTLKNGIIHRSNIDYDERIWEEFVQSIQTFLTDKKNLTTTASGKKKSTPLLIPSIRFTKLIIHYLKTKHNIHPRTNSPLHYLHDEIVLGTPRSLGKDGREIFGMSIPDALLTDEIKSAPYYGEYLEHVTKYQQYLDEERGKAGEDGVTESPKATKVTKPKAAKQTKPSAPKAAKVTKPVDDKAPKQTSSQPPKSTPSPTEPSKKDQGKKRKPVKETSDAPSLAKRSKAGKVTKKHAKDEGQARPNPGVQDEGQAGSNPGDATESQPQSSHVVHAGPNLECIDLETTDASTQQNTEQMDEEFTTTAYPNVQENIKLPTEDQEDKPEKTNTESEVQSMVMVPIHQDTSSVPPMATLVIDLTVSHPVSTTVHAPLPTSTATTTTITTIALLPPPPQPQQSSSDPILLQRIGELEQHIADLI
ncbi:hypothetical protein Tco_0637877 [Tanacetum coccineum]